VFDLAFATGCVSVDSSANPVALNRQVSSMEQ